jgi:prepilin-type N-terminal cleavage/methylation domain-containing protein
MKRLNGPGVAIRRQQREQDLSEKRMNTRGHAEDRKYGRNAYTLVEVMVAVLIVGILTMTLYAGFSQGFSVIQSARENLRATQIMVQRMETIRLYTWSQVLDNVNYLKPTFTEYYDPLGSTNNSTGTRYQGTISTQIPADMPAGYGTNMRTITVRVYWTNFSKGQPIVFSREMQTLVARYGMQNYIFGK